ncbi:MAG: phosphatase PAP2 family protein [Nanoarchaeota archaeon]|nr:phosphatase PAP2 family protein [Nanoarchaeota archaeon]
MTKLFQLLIEDMSCFGGFSFLFFYLGFLLFTGHKLLVLAVAVSLFSGLLITSLIRLIYHRLRPENKNRKHKMIFHSIFEKIYDASFPSMHAMSVSIVAYSLYFFDNRMAILAVIMAGMVYYSRNYLKKHYWTDIIAGAVLGLIIIISMLKLLNV